MYKNKIIFIVFIIFIESVLNARVKNKDIFSIVFVNKDEYAYLHNEPDKDFDILDKIPAGYSNLKTTWDTTGDIKDSWIQIIYNDKKGWLNRKYITRGYGLFRKEEKNKIEKILINLTKSLQQKDFPVFKGLFYSIRGLAIYNVKNNELCIIDFDNIKKLWDIINDKDILNDDMLWKKNLFKNILCLLEKEFKIKYNIESKNIFKKIPIELINFQFISLSYNFNRNIGNTTLIIGIEFWNNKPFISCFVIYFQ